MAIGRRSGGGAIAAPITIAVFDGTHRLLDDAEPLEGGVACEWITNAALFSGQSPGRHRIDSTVLVPTGPI